MPGIFVFAAVLLVVVLVATPFVLRRDRSDRTLIERLEAIDPVARSGKVEDAGPLPTIRAARRERGRASAFAYRFLRFAPDMPGASILPWPLVIALGVFVGFAAAWVARLYLGSILGIAAGVLAGLLVIRGIFGYGRDRYAQALFLQMPDMIESIVSTTRAGLPVSEAFRIIAKDMRAPTAEEFARVNNELAIGGSIETALLDMAERTGVPEYAIFAVAIGIQSRSGGRLSEICQNLAETIRQRVAIASRARALASESKATAIILVALPMLTGVGLSLMQPDYLQPLFADPRGQKMLLTGVGLMITGILVIRWMINWSVTD